MVGRLGFAPSSRRLRAGTSLSKFATQLRHEGGSRKAGRRGQASEVLTDTGILRRVKMARRAEARRAKAGRASGYRSLYSCLEGRRVSLNTYARDKIGVPCWICTSLCGFAGRRLS